MPDYINDNREREICDMLKYGVELRQRERRINRIFAACWILFFVTAFLIYWKG